MRVTILRFSSYAPAKVSLPNGRCNSAEQAETGQNSKVRKASEIQHPSRFLLTNRCAKFASRINHFRYEGTLLTRCNSHGHAVDLFGPAVVLAATLRAESAGRVILAVVMMFWGQAFKDFLQ